MIRGMGAAQDVEEIAMVRITAAYLGIRGWIEWVDSARIAQVA
jgi:hypothetical protein